VGLTVPSRIAAALALVLAFHPALPAESQGSIQGVWRPVSRTIPATRTPAIDQIHLPMYRSELKPTCNQG
jgi:hypothetical protein